MPIFKAKTARKDGFKGCIQGSFVPSIGVVDQVGKLADTRFDFARADRRIAEPDEIPGCFALHETHVAGFDQDEGGAGMEEKKRRGYF